MTRSIFDPAGNPEHSGSEFLGPGAKEISQLPPRFSEESEAGKGVDELDDTLASENELQPDQKDETTD